MTILRDPGTAEDVAQEAFVRAWRRAETYDPRRGTVLTWLLTIARNTAIDVARLKRAEPLDPALLAVRLDADGTQSSSNGAPPIEERERLRRALQALPAEQRRALLLAAYFGRTASEIGELERVPLGTAKTRIRTAMIRLRSELEVADER